MKKNLVYLFLGFLVFYHVVNISLVVPSIIDGHPWKFNIITTSFPALFRRLLEVAATFGLSLLTYLSLYYGVRKKILMSCVLVLLAAPLGFFCHFVLLPFIYGSDYLSHISLLIVELCIIYGAAFFAVSFIRQNQKQKKILAIQKREAELSFLRSQINPHFLFNNLNNIYSLVYDGSPASLQAISDLSDLMRYMLGVKGDKVPIASELLYITRYIELQKLRFSHAIKTEVSINGVADDIKVPPLLLIPFVENAFKHGDFSSPEEGMNLHCSITNGRINFAVKNKIRRSGSKDEVSGIGLENVQKRLDLLYPNNYSLNIKEIDSFFEIKLAIPHE